MKRSVLTLALMALLFAAAPAFASLGDEVAQGKQIAAQLNAGTTNCSKLSDSDFEHLGEYVMERMVGSRAAHEAMNQRMESMMGSATADRMHEAIGRRFAGCGSSGGVGGMTGGGGMMGGSGMMGGAGGWGAMGSWMRNGNWQHMTASDWRRVQTGLMGSGMMGRANGGWSTTAVVGVVLGALLLGGLLAFALTATRRSSGPRGPLHPSPPAGN